MPLYEYSCLNCDGKTEVIQKFSDAPLKICPTCGGRVEKLISSSAIHFKGTGWYITDYGRKGDNNGSGAKSSPQTTVEKSSVSKETSTAASSDGTRVSSET